MSLVCLKENVRFLEPRPKYIENESSTDLFNKSIYFLFLNRSYSLENVCYELTSYQKICGLLITQHSIFVTNKFTLGAKKRRRKIKWLVNNKIKSTLIRAQRWWWLMIFFPSPHRIIYFFLFIYSQRFCQFLPPKSIHM